MKLLGRALEAGKARQRDEHLEVPELDPAIQVSFPFRQVLAGIFNFHTAFDMPCDTLQRGRP
jgi:hypothetical protein